MKNKSRNLLNCIKDFFEILKEMFDEYNTVGKILIGLLIAAGVAIFILAIPAIAIIGVFIFLDYIIGKYDYLLMKKELREEKKEEQ